MKPEPVYVFLHIPKCAGSTISDHLRRNYPPEQRLYLCPVFKKTPLEKYSLAKIKAEIKNKNIDLSQIKVVHGHGARYGLHQLFDRPVRYLALVRDPISKTVSAYNHNRTQKNTKIPSFHQWLATEFAHPNAIRPTRKTTARFLQDTGFLPRKKKLSESEIRQGLAKFYFIGLTENPQDLAFMMALLQIKHFFPNDNVSQPYYDLDPTDIPAIEAKVKADLVLYHQAARLNTQFRRRHPEYSKMVTELQQRRRWRLPVQTGLTYVYQLSARLKVQFPGYARVVSTIRSNWSRA